VRRRAAACDPEPVADEYLGRPRPRPRRVRPRLTAAVPPTARDAHGIGRRCDFDTADRVLTRTETGNGLNAGPAKHTVYFYWGSGGSLAEETDGTGRTKVRYLLDGDSEALAQQSFTVNPAGTAAATGEKWTWLLHDAVGNTATLLAEDGAVVEQKAFDPYGAPSAGGSARSTDPAAPKSTLGFQSTMTDEVTGKVMLGSRQYDPTTARFTTPDTFIAAQLDLHLGTDSLTGNRYLFAAANPLAFYEDGHGMFSRLKKLSKRALPALQYVPVVSTAIDVASAATGRNWYEGGRRMKGGERLAMLGGSVAGLIPGGGIAKAGVKGALKGVDKARSKGKVRKALSDARAIVTPIGRGDVDVYEGADARGRIYTGITKDFDRRQRVHVSEKGISVQKVRGLNGLTRPDALAVEQYRMVRNMDSRNSLNRALRS
jgi:RHS repeat-associated protein